MSADTLNWQKIIGAITALVLAVTAMIGVMMPDPPKETVVILSEFWLPESER